MRLKKKWKNMKSSSKKHLSAFNCKTIATGGGTPPKPLSPVTDTVIDVIGRDNVSLTGIQDGLDTCMLQFLDYDQSSQNQIVVMAELHPEPRVHQQESLVPVQQPDIPASERQPIQTSSPSYNSLLKEKLKLEIECLKLKKKYLKMKIENLEE
ncbi:uncharacterized protein LOC121366937 [Gigantopelta aegis]|uniref:uncharacterized protein LOC121366937 n=1 Tax=Gigantopelta aegis TaxID=1735272 RepID=UPI001B88DF5D|nr:uncharacterized protein LOC121366937 [Gigantopelta aegis]